MRSEIRLFVLLACVAGTLNFQLQSVVEIVHMSKDIVVGLGKVWDVVENQSDGDMPLPFVNKAERRLLRKIHKINKHLDVVSSKVDNIGANTIAALLHTVPERMRLELRLNDLYDYLTRIDVIYSRMEDYVKATHKYERLTLEDFARSIISHDGNSVVNLMERIHTFLVPYGEGLITNGILELLLGSFQVRRMRNLEYDPYDRLRFMTSRLDEYSKLLYFRKFEVKRAFNTLHIPLHRVKLLKRYFWFERQTV